MHNSIRITRTLTMALIALMALTLAACSGGDEEPTATAAATAEPTSAPTSAPTTGSVDVRVTDAPNRAVTAIVVDAGLIEINVSSEDGESG